jgi:dTDP-glucose pyrophosphorylase
MKYQTLITAAGDSRAAFVEAGFDVPKSLVNIAGFALINQAIESYRHPSGALVVAINKDENAQFDLEHEIKQRFNDATVVEVASAVKGALATAVLAAGTLDLDAPLVISAGDSIVEGGVAAHIQSLISNSSDAGTIVFESANPRWSYINVGESGNVLQVTEKLVAGPYATVGCFYFKSAGLFLEAAKWVFLNNARVKGNFFVSTSLNYLISRGMSVGFEVIPRSSYRSFSRPADFLSQAE